MKFWQVLLALVMATPSIAMAIGAIAVDDEEGDTEPGYGFATGFATKEEASGEAMKQCREAGNRHCKVISWFETCGAYAVSRKYYGAGWGSTKRRAEDMALDKCGKNCEVVISECE